MPVPASIRRWRPEDRAAATSCAIRTCCGRGSKEGRALASAPPGANSPATSGVIGRLRSPASVHALGETSELGQALLDLRGVGRIRGEAQIAIEVRGRLREQGQAVVDQAAVADLLQLAGGHEQQELLDLQRHVEVALMVVDPLEIVDHPLENVAVLRAAEELRTVLELPLVPLGDAGAALFLGQELAAVERV